MSPASHPSEQSSAEECADCARASGCEACFEELVRRYQTRLLHFLLRRSGSRHDAEDLVQEAFLTAYRKLASYRSSWRFSTWLFTIANRLAISSRRRRIEPTGVAGEMTGGARDADPLAALQQDEQRTNLWNTAQAVLDPEAFTALWLGYVESLPADEIGLVIGRNANAVRILQHRARARLREALEGCTRAEESSHE